MNCLVIGAGQLGSRHLQSLLKFRLKKLTICVVDPNEQSLKTANERANEIEHFHILSFNISWEVIPKDLFLVIVATNSNVRESVTIRLLKDFNVHVLILEKILFPEIKAYSNVEELLKKSNTICYVNHARRMFDGYKFIKAKLKNDRYHFQIVGSNWGLACNGLHYIDLIEYLSQSKIANLNTDLVDEKLLNSKRDGFVEFTGQISGVLQNQNTFTIISIASTDVIAPAISIMGASKRLYIQENGLIPSISIFEKTTDFVAKNMKFDIPLQSNLTGSVLEEIINNRAIFLTPYKDAFHSHLVFISALLKNYNKIKGDFQNTYLPIT
jgi:predicted dehydrogenase